MATQANVEPGSRVTLTGTGTGSWAQTGGPAVTLTGTGSTRQFVAPASLTGLTLTFAFGSTVETVIVLSVTERLVAAGVERPGVLYLGATDVVGEVANPVLNLAASAGAGLVDLTWSLVDGVASSFLVERVGFSSVTDPSTASSRRFEGLTNGTTYTFRVTATLTTGATLTKSVTATPVAAPVTPNPVLTVTATAGDAQVAIAWTLSDATVTGFTVGRNGTDNAGGGPWSTTDPPTATSRIFDKLVNGTTYTFSVTANLTNGTTITKQVTATPLAPVIPTLTATATPGAGYVDVGWALTNATAAAFTVGRDGVDTDGGGAWSTEEPANVTSRRFDKLVAGSSYTFTVVAQLAGGGTLTKTATATPTGSVVVVPGPDPSGRIIPLAGKSGLPFNSLVFKNNGLSGATQLGQQRGRPMDGFMWFMSRYTWDELNSGWSSDMAAYLNAGHIIISTLPHAPTIEGDQMNQRGANNAYQSQQRAWAAARAAAGFNSPRHVIRVNWECNGNWYNWAADRPGGAAALRQATINAITNWRAGGLTQVKFDLCWNKGPSQAGADFSIFPGRQYVDAVTVDQYDQWSPAYNDAGWNSEINRTPGLKTVRDFAVANQVAWGLDEGGNTHPAGANYGGDNAFYWRKVFEFFTASANVGSCAWHVTYDDPGAPATLKHDFASNPNSFAYYRTTFGGF